MNIGDVIMTCGKSFQGVDTEHAVVGEALVVYSSEGDCDSPKIKGEWISCLGCPKKRKSKRQEIKFFTDDDIKNNSRPTGVKVYCNVVKIETQENK